jgi:hypothetical protein
MGGRRGDGFSGTGRSLPTGETSDDIEVVADELTLLQRYVREFAEIVLGLMAVRSASRAASARLRPN